MLLELLLGIATLPPRALDTPPPVVRQIDGYVGTFKGDGLVLTLRAAGDGYEGSVVVEGQTLPVKAKKAGNGIQGTFTVAGESFAFTALLEGDTLVVESDGDTYRLTKEKSTEPTGTPSNNPLKKAKTNFSEWKVFKHPLGVSFRHPGSWRVEPAGDSIYRIIPGDSAADEVILATGTESFGIKDANDPQLAPGTDTIIADQIGPQFKRTGKPESIPAASTPGAALLYEGQGGNGPVQIRVFSTVLKDMIVSFVAIGPPAKVKAREDNLRKMFGTLVRGASEIDQRLVGTWTKSSERTIDAQSSGGRRPGDASLVSNANVTVNLGADGSLSYRTQSQSIASGSGVFVETSSDDTYSATWVASEGKLIVMWGDGSEEFDYRFEGDTVVLSGGGKEIVFRRA